MKTNTLPVVDVADLTSPRTLDAIDAACREWGFFEIVNHGMDAEATAAIRREMRAFFALPLEAKRAIERSAENPWGYYDRELTKHTRDWKQIYDYGPPDGGAIVPQWPAGLPGFAAAIERYYAECEALALRLLAALARNLGAPPSALQAHFRSDHTSFLRLNYYPKCPLPARPTDLAMASSGHLGVNHHTDAGALTVLLQDEQPGLEVYHDGDWRLIEPRADALVVNVGDIVQVWSNDRYVAALHRGLVAADADRYSVPFFLNPAYRTEYAPLPSTVDAAHPARYRPIQWGEFRSLRAAGDYADHGEYVRIEHYAKQTGER